MPNQQLAEELHKPTIKIYKMQVTHFFQLGVQFIIILSL